MDQQLVQHYTIISILMNLKHNYIYFMNMHYFQQFLVCFKKLSQKIVTYLIIEIQIINVIISLEDYKFILMAYSCAEIMYSCYFCWNCSLLIQVKIIFIVNIDYKQYFQKLIIKFYFRYFAVIIFDQNYHNQFIETDFYMLLYQWYEGFIIYEGNYKSNELQQC